MSNSTVPDIEWELEHACTWMGRPLADDAKDRLRALIANPRPETWDEANGITLREGTPTTLWQIICHLDPTFPRSAAVGEPLHGQKPSLDEKWPVMPSQTLLIAALRWATH